VQAQGKSLFDQLTLANLLQPCAAIAPVVAGLPFASDNGSRCDALNGGSLVGATLGFSAREQYAFDVLRQLHAAGWEPESDGLHGVYAKFMTPYVAAVHANAYARASVKDNLCDLSFGGEMSFAYSNFGIPLGFVGPRVVSAAESAAYFGKASGLPPMEQVGLLDNVVPVLPSYVAEVRGPQCLRDLFAGSDAKSIAVRAGAAESLRTGNLRGKPTLIVQGRADALAPANHSSRPYVAVSRVADGASKLAYVEVTNAQHFDAFIPAANLPGFDTRYVPMQRYFNQAMDLVFANLKSGATIPPSQVVRTTPRGGTPGAAPAITVANVPSIATTPAAGDAITFSNATLTIPD
jgi:hydroxybutyrate-dimer hydrolase